MEIKVGIDTFDILAGAYLSLIIPPDNTSCDNPTEVGTTYEVVKDKGDYFDNLFLSLDHATEGQNGLT